MRPRSTARASRRWTPRSPVQVDDGRRAAGHRSIKFSAMTAVPHQNDLFNKRRHRRRRTGRCDRWNRCDLTHRKPGRRHERHAPRKRRLPCSRRNRAGGSEDVADGGLPRKRARAFNQVFTPLTSLTSIHRDLLGSRWTKHAGCPGDSTRNCLAGFGGGVLRNRSPRRTTRVLHLGHSWTLSTRVDS